MLSALLDIRFMFQLERPYLAFSMNHRAQLEELRILENRVQKWLAVSTSDPHVRPRYSIARHLESLPKETAPDSSSLQSLYRRDVGVTLRRK